MQNLEIQALLQAQKDFFNSGTTRNLSFRKKSLERLYDCIRRRETEILAALNKDLGKSAFEGYMCEVGMSLDEIRYSAKHLKSWAKPRKVRTPLAQFCSKSYRLPTPRGNTLIISPWNYPFLLTIGPLADALAAGNTAIVKPSAYSPATSEVLRGIIAECFPPEYVAVVTGGRAENACLLEQNFDFIFFTGSQTVGKEVMRRAAEHLTPIALELGGKSPCIVDETANIELAAKRIVFGKFVNCGQTCVAPDYILCHARVKEKLLGALRAQIQAQYGEQPLQNPHYGKIINEKHFTRLCGLIDGDKVAFGGRAEPEKQRIEPTLMTNMDWSDKVMQEEIFGPILPVLSFENFEEIYSLLQDKQKPLACYLFTQNKKRAREAFGRLQFGGGCINDVIIHLATHEMGFGGVKESGMGAYHGKTGFDLFSHSKSIVDKKTWVDLNIRYQPYTKGKEKAVRTFLK